MHRWQIPRSHTQPTQTTTIQTQAADQVLTDEQLEALNGGGFWGGLFYILGDVVTLGGQSVADELTGGHIREGAFS